MTSFTPRSKNTTTFSAREKQSQAGSILVGNPIGLLLALTYAVEVAATTTFTGRTKNSTSYSPRSKS